MIHYVIKNKKIIYLIYSLLFVIGICNYFFSDNILGKESIINFVMLFFAYSIQQNAENIEQRTKKCAFSFSFIFSCALVIGKILYDTNEINGLFQLKNLLITMISIFSFTVVFGSVVAVVFSHLIKIEQQCFYSQKKLWKILQHPHIYFLIWLFIFICWLPTFLAYYPGVLSYDIPTQTIYANAGFSGYSKYHPPLHTFIWQICLSLGDITKIQAITIYTIIQMLFLSAVLAKLITFFIQKHINNWIILISFLFISINPVVSIFSLEPTKDVYFAGFLMLTVLQICQLISNPKEFTNSNKSKTIFVIFAILSCLFRNNAIYMFILTIPFAIIELRKYWKKILLLFIIPIIGFYFVNNLVYDKLGIKEGHSEEALCVPMQQITNVVVTDEDSLSDELKDKINVYFNYEKIKELYNPRFADYIKFYTFKPENYNKDKIGFYKLWFQLFLHYPDDYVNAFLTLNLLYWYSDTYSVDDVYPGRRYISTKVSYDKELEVYSNKDYIDGLRRAFKRIFGEDGYYTYDKLPRLLPIYENAASYKLFRDIPLISNLFSIATPIWAIIFCFFVMLLKDVKGRLLILALPFLLWFTHMAGPISNFRYIFPLFILYPLFLVLILEPHLILSSSKEQ